MATILGSLALIYADHQESKLIIQLTNYFHFDQHFFLLHSAEVADRYISTKIDTPRTLC